jgi:hypothetical protein
VQIYSKTNRDCGGGVAGERGEGDVTVERTH